VSSVSLMVNTPGFEEAVALARACPALGVGVHLNLLKGRPLLEPQALASLVTNTGELPNLRTFLGKAMARRINWDEVRAELGAQIHKAAETGLRITHLDSHRHWHVWPKAFRVVAELAVQHEIKTLRLPRCHGWPRNWKEGVLRGLSWRCTPTLNALGLYHNDWFYDLLRVEATRNPIAAFAEFCRTLPPGATDLACHPGVVTPELTGSETSVHDREKQLALLTRAELRGIIDASGVRLIGYSHLSQT